MRSNKLGGRGSYNTTIIVPKWINKEKNIPNPDADKLRTVTRRPNPVVYDTPPVTTRKEIVIPKGAKQYFFDREGGSTNYSTHDTVYSTISISDGRAKKKFQKNYNSTMDTGND